mgnify:CR=1 FL=1
MANYLNVTETFSSEILNLKSYIDDLETKVGELYYSCKEKEDHILRLQSELESYNISLVEVCEMSVWEFANWKVLRWWFK